MSFFLDVEKSSNKLRGLGEIQFEFQFYISESFLNFIKNQDFQKDNVIGLEILKFFGWKVVDFDKIYDFITNNLNLIKPFSRSLIKLSPSDYNDKFGEISSFITKTIPVKLLQDIIMEEWIFVQEFSAIVAIKKKIVSYFEKAGVAIVSFGKTAFPKLLKLYDEKIVRKILKIPIGQSIKNIDRLRVLGKFVIIGLNNWLTSYLSESPEATAGFIFDMIVVFDPI